MLLLQLTFCYVTNNGNLINVLSNVILSNNRSQIHNPDVTNSLSKTFSIIAKSGVTTMFFQNTTCHFFHQTIPGFLRSSSFLFVTNFQCTYTVVNFHCNSLVTASLLKER